MVNAAAAYRTAEIDGLTQRDLIVQLYLGIERFLRTAAEAMRAANYPDAHFGCVRSKAIIAELLSTLNFEQGGEIATRLRDLYIFLIDQITEANLRKQPATIDAILPVVVTLREAWQGVPGEHANTTALPPGEHRQMLDLRT